MSGITGIVRQDGATVSPSTLEAITSALAVRGPDGSGTAIRGSAGVGQQQMVTTPEARHERIPEQTDRYLLTADARIDNRDDLQNRLDVSLDPVVTDADLILAAYERWGLDCPEHLIGAFAFAIWDAEDEQLFCARDHAGLRPFFYANTDDVFAFASEIEPLLEPDFVSARLDEIAVGDYLLNFTDDTRRTFYADVRALPPAHQAVVDANSVEIQQYWSLDGPELELDSDEAYLDEFESRFEEAVRARLRTPDDVRVGSYLSGGLDSSSVACTANSMVDEPFPTFSLAFDDVYVSDEREYVDAVHDHQKFDSHFVRGDRHSPFERADEMLNRMDRPFAASTFFLRWELNRAAENADIGVLLDGFGGDQTISHGLARFPELVVTGHPLKLSREVKSYAQKYDKSIRWVLYRRVLTPLEPKSVRQLRRRLFDTADPVARRSKVIDKTFAERIDLASRIRQLEERRRLTMRADHRRILGGGKQADGCELSNLSAAAFGIEPRFPFLDRRVMEFCFRTPGHLKFRDGWRRWLLRNALSETLPPKVRKRTTKGTPGSALYEMLRSHDGDVLEELFTADDFPTYLDQDRVQAEYEEFTQGDGSNPAANVWRPALLCRWFQLTDRYE